MALPAPISSFETIIGPVQLTTGTVLQYTAPGLRRISDIYLTSDANTRTVNLYIVPPTATGPGNTNKFLDGFSTIANDLRPVTGLNYAINKGWTIYAQASGSGTKLVVVAYR